MEIGNSFLAYTTASMYSASNAARLNSAAHLAGTSSNAAEISFPSVPNRDQAPARRVDRSDPADVSLSMNVYGPDGRSVSGVMQRPSAVLGTSPMLSPEQASAGLPDSPEILFSNLASGMQQRGMAALTQNLSRAQEYAQQLNASAQSTQSSMQSMIDLVSERTAKQKETAALTEEKERTVSLADKAAEDRQTQGKSADERSEANQRLTEAAGNFVSGYNTMLNTLSRSPNQSRQAALIERSMENAVNRSMDSLNEIGMNQNADGTLRLDEERFAQAVSDNPQAIQNLFNQNSNFTREVNRAADSAEDTRSIRNAEIDSAFQSSASVMRNFSTYQASIQSTSMVSMNIPSGVFINRYA